MTLEPSAVPVRGYLAAIVVGRAGNCWSCTHHHDTVADALACARAALAAVEAAEVTA